MVIKSNSISLTFYNTTQNQNEIKIQFKNSINLTIEKNNLIDIDYEYFRINDSFKNQFKDSSIFYKIFNLSGSNVSIHFQIKPNNSVVSYLMVLKFGNKPILDNNNYDLIKIFCEKGSRT